MGQNFHAVFLHLEKSLFVLPTFEINLKNVNEIPKEKSQLIHLLDSGAVQPFYFTQCQNCHKATNYEKWRGLVPRV